MSDAFVDVSWRGLEVGRKVKLRSVHAEDAYLEHSTPMPVGTLLSISTDEGYEIPATVVRVHEQVGGSTETPGMQIVPKALEGAARAWWTARAEATVTAEMPAPPVAVHVPVAAAAAPEAAAPAAAGHAAAAAAPVAAPVDGNTVLSVAAMHAAQSDPRAEITSRPTLTMSTVEMERALAAQGAAVDPGGSRTEVMTAINPDTLDGVVEPGTTDDGLVDDGRRTMAMSAVDISAIVEAATEPEPSGPVDDDISGDSGPVSSGAGATSKKKRAGGKRTKRR